MNHLPLLQDFPPDSISPSDASTILLFIIAIAIVTFILMVFLARAYFRNKARRIQEQRNEEAERAHRRIKGNGKHDLPHDRR